MYKRQLLGLSPSEQDTVRHGALLHDVGKLAIPNEILHKPGPLNESEWEVVRQHPLIGERILRAIHGMTRVATVVRHVQERWDGGGYPDGLAGTDIPIASRIILGCVAYHAMTSDRPNRPARTHTDAIAELSRVAGTQLDPEVTEALIGYLYGRRESPAGGL